MLPILIGVLAFAFDAGIAMANHQRARTAADAAAQAGAFAIGRERTNLYSPDAAIKKLALDRVLKTARLAAEENGFKDGIDNVKVQVNYPPTTQQSQYYSSTAANYIGVTVTTPILPFFANALPSLAKAFSNDADKKLMTMAAHAVGRAGSTTTNTCPGLYIYGNANKVLDLSSGSDFRVSGGGIFINYNSTGTALYGSSGATMHAEWIEKNVDAGQTGSVAYTCSEYPVGSPCPKPVNKREEPEKPPTPTCPSATQAVCIYAGSRWSGCGINDCTGNKCKGSSTSLGTSPQLEAGEYCNGLTIVNTGTSANPLILKPSSTTNIFNLNGSNLTIRGSNIRAVANDQFDGVTLFSFSNSNEMGVLNIGAQNIKDSRSTVDGQLRAYFNSIWLTNHSTDNPSSILDITSFEEDGCGKIIDPIAVVQ